MDERLSILEGCDIHLMAQIGVCFLYWCAALRIAGRVDRKKDISSPYIRTYGVSVALLSVSSLTSIRGNGGVIMMSD